MNRPIAMTLAAAVWVVGCRAPAGPVTPPPPPPVPTSPAPAAAAVSPASPLHVMAVPRPANPPVDPAPPPQTIVNLQVYALSVPFGTVSRSDAFWKRVDESGIDIATYDVLQKNGVRAGTAATADWDNFRSLLELYPAKQQRSDFGDAGGRAVELPVRTSVDESSIFYLNPDNRLVGRTFDRSEGLISIAFSALPRKPGHVRIALCPIVRSLKKRLDFTPMHNEVEQPVVETDRLYDLRLQAEIPPDHFLIVAPSAEATWPTSLGNVFFTTKTAGEQTELVLLLVPKQMRLTSTTTKLLAR